MRVGFVGLGTMGALMAANILKNGFELVVHDVRREAAEGLTAAGAVWADTPRALAEQCEVVMTSLPGPAEFEHVCLGENGLLTGLKAGAAHFDLTTNAPSVVKRAALAYQERGVYLFDTPVSGGPKAGLSGKLAIWVGGDEAVFTQRRAVLDAIGHDIEYIGPVGSASVAKLVHNCAGYAINAALAEVFTMGVKAGVDPLILFRAIRGGGIGRQRAFDRLPNQFLIDRYEPANFTLKLAHKDVTLATQLARELMVPMKVCELTLADMTEALNRGWGHMDSRVAMKLQEERSNVSAKTDPNALKTLMADTKH